MIQAKTEELVSINVVRILGEEEEDEKEGYILSGFSSSHTYV